MSLGCMILHHPSISRLTKSFILRIIFQAEDIEIEVMDASTTVIYLWNVRKERIWQATAYLESVHLTTVYSFAETKEDALKGALKHLRPSFTNL